MKTEQQEELNLIKQMVSESQGVFETSRSYFIMWGLAVPLATFITMLLDRNALTNYISLTWLITTIPCSIASFIIGLKTKPLHSTTFTKLYGRVWIGVGIANLIMIFALFTESVQLNVALAAISLFLGLGYIVASYMQKSIILKIASILWYILAIVLLLVKNDNSGYIMGIASFFMTFIPGVLMGKKHE